MTRPPDKRKSRPGGSGPSKITSAKRISSKDTILGLDKGTLVALVDLAIMSGAAVMHIAGGIVICPDTLLLEGEANGHKSTPTTLLRRDDGRTAAVYRMPKEWR